MTLKMSRLVFWLRYVQHYDVDVTEKGILITTPYYRYLKHI